MAKKILAVLLALAMTLSLFSVNVFAADEVVEYETAVSLITDGKGLTGTAFTGPTIGWGSKAIESTSAEWADFVEAVNTEGARFVLKYTITGEPGKNDKGEDDYGWFNFFQASTEPGGTGHVSVPNYSSDAGKFVDTLDGEVMSNQWSLLHAGEHVVTYNTADWLEVITTHTCTDHHPDGGVTLDDVTNLCFQSGIPASLEVAFSSLVVEVPKTADPEPDPGDEADTVSLYIHFADGQDNEAKINKTGKTVLEFDLPEGFDTVELNNCDNWNAFVGSWSEVGFEDGTVIKSTLVFDEIEAELDEKVATYTYSTAGDGHFDIKYYAFVESFVNEKNIVNWDDVKSAKKLTLTIEVNPQEEPEPDVPAEKYETPVDLGLFVGDTTNGWEPRTTIEVTESGAYEIEWTGDSTNLNWIILKSATANEDPQPTAIPEGTEIKITSLVVNGKELTFKEGKGTYTVGADGKVEIQIINTFIGAEDVTEYPSSGVTSVKVSFVIAANETDPDEPEPDEPKAPECKEDHVGWTVVDVSSYKNKNDNFYVDLPETAKTGDKMSIHIIGTVTGSKTPRFFIANDGEWSNNFTNSYDHVLTVTDGVFNYTATEFILSAPPSGSGTASRIAFRDVEGLTITHLAYHVIPPEVEPKGYVEDEALTNAAVEETDDNIVITPNGDVKTEGLLISLEEPAAEDGKIIVSVSGGNIVTYDYEKVDALSIEKLAPDRVENGVITFTDAWGDCPGIWIGDESTITGYDSLQLTVDSVSNFCQFHVAFTDGSDNVVRGFEQAGKVNISIDPKKTIKQVFVQCSVKGGTVAISDILLRKAPDDVASEIEVSFEAGTKYIVVPTKSAKDYAIKSITIVTASAVGGKDNIVSVKVMSEDEYNPFAGLNGYTIQLGEDYHGFLFGGHLITLPHTFGDDNICTACSYERKDFDSEADDTVEEPKLELTTLDQGDSCVIDISDLGLKSGDTVHIKIAGTVNTSVDAIRLFLATEGAFNNNASDIVNAELDGNSFTFEGDLTAQGDILYLYLKSQAGGPALHPNNFEFTVFSAEKA